MSEQLNKALASVAGNPNAFADAKDIHPMIYNILLDELPLWKIMGTERAQGPVHQYRVRATLPEAWVEGELANPNFQSATHTVREAHLKIVRSWGGVSSFMQRTTERWLNALEESIKTSVEGLANTLEFLIMYGNRGADQYQPNGLFAEMIAHSIASQSLLNGGNIYDVNAAFTLSHLDRMIDRAQAHRSGRSDRYIAVMSREMISRVSALQTRVTRDVPTVAFDGGFEMVSYRNIGLMPSDVVSPKGTTTSPTPTAAAAAGGSLPDGTYYYYVASVTLEGEQKPGSVVSAAAAAPNSTINLTWTADPAAKLYHIYRGTTTGPDNASLLAVIAAKTYDANGNVTGNVTSFSDTGALTPKSAIKPLNVGETIWLVNVDPGERGVKMLGAVSPLGDPIDDFFTYTPLATINAAFRFMIEGFVAPKIPYPDTIVVARRATLS